MDKKKTVAELYSDAIMEAAAALAGAGFNILNISGLNTYTAKILDIGKHEPDSVRLELMITKEVEKSNTDKIKELLSRTQDMLRQQLIEEEVFEKNANL
jgi:hypothetical protein